ncbi:DISARM system helicase DrmA [Anaerovibrio sp. RM50]|uniref:DISARM system helicase DrmA n=1 Tax=Anaerovibrio sp. RM50 TaxID=1200557 RepID=UPI00048756B1|nr:DISARM system helicase DrmA [Anaerovibrio sp. RM50]
MAERSDYLYAQVRKKMLDAVRMDLIGPTSENEALTELPTSSYITGMLYPADSTITEDENYNDIEFTEGRLDADGNATESVVLEDEEPEETSKGGFKKPSAIGISFYIAAETSDLDVDVYWGTYSSDKFSEVEVIEESSEEAEANQKKKKRQVYVREQQVENLHLDMNAIGRTKKLLLKTNTNVSIYVIQMPLDNGYKMVSVYLHNNDKGSGEKEYEHVMFQVELQVSSPSKKGIFIPEYICRKKELEDEYYYKGRPVYGRGRGCAAIWEKKEEEQFAYLIKSSFIPDHEIPSVSSQVSDVPDNAFSMLQLGTPKKKEVSIANLRLLTALYGDWIKNELKENPEMLSDAFVNTGNNIIQKCEEALRRMNDGIDLIEQDERAFKAFTFMNQAMYLQRSITAYSKDCGRGISCSLRDYMKDIPEKGLKQDHSEWRPFQIAFILLNLKGLMDTECDDRRIVDLLYFPTGGGKTEAYLGLIAFTVAYRRLTASDEVVYEKDGGVTVFLRYTLRLLTTQQRDRLLKLIVAMEDLRERSEKKGATEFGKTPISIGFWVGGGVTPNRFEEYEKDEYSRKEFIRKVTKQIIRCPYCGRVIKRDNYDIKPKSHSVMITCGNEYCKYSKKSIPVYLVDEEIYAQCPTVIISTVDKFARLPWSEQVGLLFGRTDRRCPRHGYQAIGYDKELLGKRHNKDAANELEACVIEGCKPFYPPELIIQDELHLISGPLGTIYGGYETVVEDMCCIERNGVKIRPKYVVSTATIKNAGEQIKCLYARGDYAQFPPKGFDTRDSYFIREVPLISKNLDELSEADIKDMLNKGEKPFRQYVGVCASGQSVKTTLIRLYSVLLQEAFILSEDPQYQDFVDPYYTLVGYFNSIRELGGAVRLLDDDISSRLKVLKKKYKNARQRYLGFDGKKEITSRIPSYQIAEILEKLAEPFIPGKERQNCYDVVTATNMIAVGMDVDRLGLMAVVGQPKQNSEYIQATSRVGRKYPGIIFTVYNPYRPRDLSNYENFVGFHSQMYRYVEGTTATPFAARARDRVLHALVVALLRLQNEAMAGNKGASNILVISDEALNEVKQKILNRVAVVAPSAYVAAEEDMNAFISTWKEFAKKRNLYYFVANTENNKRLLSYYGQVSSDKEKPTLNSMRDVEQSSAVYLYEEGGQA